MKLYLLEVYPETVAVLNHIVGMLERDGVSFEIVVNVRLKGVMLNWITGWTLNQRQYRTCPTIEEMVGQGS
jgi:adenylate kinase family enzyme